MSDQTPQDPQAAEITRLKEERDRLIGEYVSLVGPANWHGNSLGIAIQSIERALINAGLLTTEGVLSAGCEVLTEQLEHARKQLSSIQVVRNIPNGRLN